MSNRIHGQCMCGAVTVSAVPAKDTMHLCHCDMCRRHNGAGFLSVATVDGTTEFTGPAKTFKSSDWASRAFCETCGSTLWYSVPEHNIISLSAGLFDNAGGHRLDMEYFIDKKPQGYALAGDHTRMTTQETLAMFAPEEGDAK